MRLIDADTLKNEMCEDCSGDCTRACTRDCYEVLLIKAQPTIDAEPVRRGKWERCGIKTYDFAFYCSECSSFSPNGVKTKYCPWCGAKMEEDNEAD